MSLARTIGEARRKGELPDAPAGTCWWCRKVVLKNGRRFCSGARARFAADGSILPDTGQGCAHEWAIRGDTNYARRLVFARDRGVCATCKRDNLPWQADHIIPVIEGGGLAGLGNFRTLCVECHKGETAELAGRRARAAPAGLLPRTVTSCVVRADGSIGVTRPLAVLEYDDAFGELVAANHPYATMHWRFPIDGGVALRARDEDAPRNCWEPYTEIALVQASLLRIRGWVERHRGELERAATPPRVEVVHELPPRIPWPPARLPLPPPSPAPVAPTKSAAALNAWADLFRR